MWWKIYFWCALGFLVLNIYFFASFSIDIFQIIQLGFITLVLLGLYSYVFRKQLLPNHIWKYLLYAYLVLMVIRVLYTIMPLDSLLPFPSQLENRLPSFHQNYWMANFLGEIITLLFTLPVPFALHRLSKQKVAATKKK